MKLPLLIVAVGTARAAVGDNIQHVHVSAHKYGKIGRCQGDCDKDSQCATGLKCKQRGYWDSKTITGCEGSALRDWDYCYEPVSSHSTTLRHYTHSAHLYGKIGQCKGDCDRDSQCMPGLKCKERHSWHSTTITGCKGVAKSNWDYCYKPAAPTRTPTRKPTAMPTRFPTRKPTADPTAYPTRKPTAYPTRKPTTATPTAKPTVAAHLDATDLTTHGYQAHTIDEVKVHGLGMCQGDCDHDSQCRGSMVCYHSHKSGNIVTGCEGKTLSMHDYCYQPLAISSPMRCAEWTCADWCKYYDPALETSGVYKTSGCVDDGVESCNCP
jgi:hypothetical protein